MTNGVRSSNIPKAVVYETIIKTDQAMDQLNDDDSQITPPAMLGRLEETEVMEMM